MAGRVNGDDFLSDGDLDDLPPNALEELEKSALRQTQHQTQATVIIEPCPSSDYGYEFDDEDLDDALVIDETRGVPSQFPLLQQLNASLDNQRDRFNNTRYWSPEHLNSFATGPLVHESPFLDPTIQRHDPKQAQLDRDGPGTRLREEVFTQAVPRADVDALQQEIQVLRHRRDELERELELKRGEVSIVRTNHEKLTKDHHRELESVRQSYRERLAQQEKFTKEAQELVEAKTTELKFIKRDLCDEAEKVRNLKRGQENSKNSSAELITTPKKNKAFPYRDGFDEDEIQIISPSAFQARKSNPGTPTKARAKRKRKMLESPVPSLEVAEEEHSIEVQTKPSAPILNDALLEKIKKPDDRLDFLEAIFDHQPCRGRLRTLEEFAKIAFPSTPSESFASIILGKLPTLGLKRVASEFAVEFCELLISIWSRCLEEEYYIPLFLLVDLLAFALELKTLTVSPFIIGNLLIVAQRTGELIAIPRFQRESAPHFEKDIDVTTCLAVMHLAAVGCMSDKGHTIRFWKTVRLGFVLTVLSKQQSPKDIDIMLQLLSMSTTKDSIGPTVANIVGQQPPESWIVDRISAMLIHPPTLLESSLAYDSSTTSNLRLQVLRTLITLSQTAWGEKVIAAHETAIGRLMKFMSDELELLYDYHSGHKQSALLISLSVRLLHHIIIKYDKYIDMHVKLSIFPGGMRRCLISLARLAFSEYDLVLNAGIDSEVGECAYEMLGLAVSPEEFDAIDSAFSNH